MANIDNLNFEVILKDDEFKTKIENDKRLAQELNVTLSDLLNVQEQLKKSGIKVTGNGANDAIKQQKLASAVAQRAAAEERLATAQTNRKAASERLARDAANRANAESRAEVAILRSAQAQTKLLKSIKNTNGAYAKQGDILKSLKGLAASYLSVRGAWQLLSSLVRVTGEFELQKTTLSAMLGDLNKAESIMANIKNLAVQSPFTFGELSTYAKQLSAFSVPAEELYETTKMLADVSAGLGVGMDRIVLAYGQVRSAAFLRGQEVRQFTEAGIPILAELAKQFEELEGEAVSAGEVFDRISARLVPFEMVAKVLKDMTSEGGKFYQMQEIQSETLRGKVLKLKDAYQIMLNEIGEDKSGWLKGRLDSITDLMKHWEGVVAVLKSVIVTYGVYKGALAAVTAYEKIAVQVELYKKWQRLNSIYKLTNNNLAKLGTAMKVFGITSKAAVSVALAAFAGLVTIIASAWKNANALKKEMSTILSTEIAHNNKSKEGLSNLVTRLKEAKQGSQEYREAISELNRKYGEYLPKIFSEADAFSQVEAAANAAAEAIRNKAKANAYEKGQSAIEEKYGKELSASTETLLNTIANFDPSISKDLATEFIQNFNQSLREASEDADPYQVLHESFDRYFGKGAFLNRVNKLYDYNYLTALENAVKAYGNVRKTIQKEEEKLDKRVEAAFGSSQYQSKEEREKVSEIEARYNREVEALKKLEMTQEDYNDKVEELNLAKLKELAEVYESLDRPEIAKSFREQIKALTEVPKGWRGTVQNVLKEMGLTKNKSFGLWAEDTTQSVTYVDEMVKRYKALKDEIKMVEPFDPSKTKKLKTELAAINAVAKALKIDIKELAATGSDTAEAKEEARLKRLISSLRTLQDQYEKLKKLGVSDTAIKTLFESIYPDLISENGKEFVTDLKFLDRAAKLAKQLNKINPDAAKKVLVDIGKDEASQVFNMIEAMEKYKKSLQEWTAEDFNLGGKGFEFDLNKVVSDYKNAESEIDQKRQKNLEMLQKAQLGDAEALKEVRLIYGEEVWQEYITNGKAAIDELARKEKEAAKATAKEKARDAAKAYLQEMLKDKNIDVSELSEKNISQVREILKRLNEEYAATQGKIDELGTSTEEGSDIKLEGYETALENLGILIGDTGEELDKKVGEKIKNVVANLSKGITDLGEDISELGEAIKSDFLEIVGEQFSDFGGLVDNISSKVETLAKELKDVEFDENGKALTELSEGAKAGVVALIATAVVSLFEVVSNEITKAHEQQDRLTNASKEYKETLLDIRREAYSGIFGTDEMSLAAENMQILIEAQERYNSTLEDFNKIRFQGSGYKDSYRRTSLSDVLTSISSEQGWDLYRENGELNIDALEAYYEAYSHRLTRKQKKLIDKVIEEGAAVEDAAAKQSEYITKLFSNAADNIASSMVDAFIETGDAATDLGNIVGNVAKEMAADLIRSLYFKGILDKYEAQIAQIQGNGNLSMEEKTAQSLDAFNAAVEEIGAQGPQINATLEKLSKYWEGMSEETSQGLSEGIKGITEDTANLLASYLNAMRSDVSQMRTLQAEHLPIISAAMPTILDHLAQINAHAFDTAQHTQSMLSELISINSKFGDVIGSGGDGSAIKVLM